MLPFDYCCASVKKDLKKRTCRVCHQYIPSAYRMKNHYKIHAQHFDDLEQEKEEEGEGEGIESSSTLPMIKDGSKKMKESILHPMTTTTTTDGGGGGACKTEMLDWLRADFDQVDIGSTTTTTTNAKQNTNSEDDWVHLD